MGSSQNNTNPPPGCVLNHKWQLNELLVKSKRFCLDSVTIAIPCFISFKAKTRSRKDAKSKQIFVLRIVYGHM